MPSVKKNITITIVAKITVDDYVHVPDLTTEKLKLSHNAIVEELTTIDIVEDNGNEFDNFLERADMPQD